jgi:hypothetical protein
MAEIKNDFLILKDRVYSRDFIGLVEHEIGGIAITDKTGKKWGFQSDKKTDDYNMITEWLTNGPQSLS